RLATKAKGHQAIDRFLRYNPLYRRNVADAIREFDAADLDGRMELTERWTARILEHARRTPYGCSFGSRFDDWPILEKKLLRDAPENLVASGFARFPASTSGTTGLPIRLSRSMECIAAEQAFIDHILSPYGVSFRASRVAVLRGDDVKDPADQRPPYGRVVHQGRRLMLSNPHLSPETVDWFVGAIREFRPDILWVYPSMMANLLHCMDLKGLEFQVPVVLLSSEMLSPGAFEAIEQRLSARVVDYYGQAERVCFAVAHRPHEYRFLPSYGRVELVPDEIEEGGPPTARIYATGFWNRAMPLVRFDTGDRAVLPGGTSPEDLRAIELGIVPFTGIAGRAAEFIVTPDGGAIASLNHLPREVDNVFQLQVVQEKLDAIDIRVLPRPAFDEADRQQILHNARQKIPPEIAINIVVVSRLEKSPNGKVPFVIRRV
ncbi:MAG TPA: AMP-binding protein, partial [Alphaproteobacteria bacterium]|nr:AMP-binding protein [Alphaproteobacteria bacterium]